VCATGTGLGIVTKDGFYRKQEQHVLNYDSAALHFKSGIYVALWNGLSVLADHWQHHGQGLIMSGIAVLTAMTWQTDSLYAVYNAQIKEIANSFLTITSFMMGGFVAFVVAKWMARRTRYIALVGELKAFLVIMAGTIKGSSIEKEKMASECRDTLVRYSKLTLDLAVLKCRGHMDTDRGKQWMIEEGLIVSEKEWELMVPGARQHSVISWMATLLTKAVDEGLLTPETQAELNALFVPLRSNASDMLDPIMLDVPFPYAHHLAFLVKCVIISHAVLFGTLVFDSDGDRKVGPVVVAAIFAYVVQCVFQGLVDLQHKLYNPFLEDLNSIPHDVVLAGLGQLGEGLNKAAHCDLHFNGEWT